MTHPSTRMKHPNIPTRKTHGGHGRRLRAVAERVLEHALRALRDGRRARGRQLCPACVFRVGMFGCFILALGCFNLALE